MGFSFLAPLFLAGALAVAVPVLVHLSQKTKKESVPFPSLMFLSRVPYRETRKQRIRHWVVFLLRVTAVLLLAAAFARPLLDNVRAGGAGAQDAREVVVLLDRSLSMAYGDRWERAKQAAQEVVAELGPADQATVITFSDRAEALRPLGRDVSTLSTVLERVELSHGATNYGPAVELAEQVLIDSRIAAREVVLISDFQRAGWNDDVTAQLPPGTQLRLLDMGDPEPANLAVGDVTFDRSFGGDREQVSVLARVINMGPIAADNLSVTLEIDGVSTATQAIDLEPNDAVTVRFRPVVMPDRDVRGVVRAGADDLPLDNEFRFVLSPKQTLSVLLLQHPAAPAEVSLYLERALAIGSDPPFRVASKRVTAFAAADLEGKSVVILNDCTMPRGTGGAVLRDFVERGGGLLVAVGQRSGAEAWRSGLDDVVPASRGAPIDRLNDRGGTLSVTDYDHPVFELFSVPRSGDFSRVRFFRYRPVNEPEAGRVIARFDDGNISLVDATVEEGRVLLWTSDLTNSWNDLPLQPVFLPFVHQMVRYLADYRSSEPSLTAGQAVDLVPLMQQVTAGSAGAVLDEQVVFGSPSGKRRVVEVDAAESPVVLDESGFYEFRRLGGRGDVLRTLAVNVDAVESDLTPLDLEEFAGAITSPGDTPAVTAMAATLTPVERERRQGLWWYLLFGVLLILMIESVWSNRVAFGRR